MTEFAPQQSPPQQSPPQPRPRRRRPPTPATKFLLMAILAGFAIEAVRGGLTDPIALAKLGAVYGPLVFEYGQYWRLLSAMFLHGNGTIPGALLHIVLNMLSLAQLGTLYEMMFGTWRLVVIYFGAGILASLTSAVVGDRPSVGASGAVFGVVGALMASIWRTPHYRRQRMARSIVNQLIFWTVANVLIGLQIEQIDNSAHIGGLVAGALIGAILPRPAPPPPPPPAQTIIDVRPHE